MRDHQYELFLWDYIYKMFEEHEKLDQMDGQFKYIIHNNIMYFSSPDLIGQITYNEMNDTFTINGQTSPNQTIHYMSTSPLWRNYSYSGSGLPYPNPVLAYDRTPNRGIISTDRSGQFRIQLQHPSSYYIRQGTILLKPHVHLYFPKKNKNMTLVVGDYLPFRSLTGLPNQPNRTIGR